MIVSVIQKFCLSCIKYFSFVCLNSSSFALGWVFALAQLTSGGPSLCLNFGPTSEPGVNKGLGFLLAFSGVCFGLFSFPSRYVLGKYFFI